jgi:hypothetical protein
MMILEIKSKPFLVGLSDYADNDLYVYHFMYLDKMVSLQSIDLYTPLKTVKDKKTYKEIYHCQIHTRDTPVIPEHILSQLKAICAYQIIK